MLQEIDSLGKGLGGLGAIGAAIYGMWRMLKKDRREDKSADTKDDAMQQVIQTLREEIARLSVRLEKVEAENADCQKKYASSSAKIIKLEALLGIHESEEKEAA